MKSDWKTTEYCYLYKVYKEVYNKVHKVYNEVYNNT